MVSNYEAITSGALVRSVVAGEGTMAEPAFEEPPVTFPAVAVLVNMLYVALAVCRSEACSTVCLSFRRRPYGQ